MALTADGLPNGGDTGNGICRFNMTIRSLHIRQPALVAFSCGAVVVRAKFGAEQLRPFATTPEVTTAVAHPP
jgi:hypothetical protein